jgi:hypothetical protein
MDVAAFPDEQMGFFGLAAMYFAGRQAECLLRGAVPGGYLEESASDDHQARFWLSAAFGRSSSSAPAGGCQEFARTMLRVHWTAVKAVAALLLQENTSSGSAIRAALLNVSTPDPRDGWRAGTAAAGNP